MRAASVRALNFGGRGVPENHQHKRERRPIVQHATTTIVVELSEPEPGTYLAKATRDDGEVALVQSSESIYEASAYALARVTATLALAGCS